MSKSSKATYLDGSGIEKSLRIVKNEAEEQLESIFAPVAELAEEINSGRSKVVKPAPGFCIKAFRKDTKEKFFINVCQTDGIPAPRDITEDELIAVLNDGEPNRFRIPMSITIPRQIVDKSNRECTVCDIAINDAFFKRIEPGGVMREFLINVLFDGIEGKHSIVLDDTSYLILKNKKFMDRLIPHNIQNRDVRQVLETYEDPSDADREMLRKVQDKPSMAGGTRPPGRPLIEEIDPSTIKTVKNDTNSTRTTVAGAADNNAYVPDPTKVAISQAATRKPESKLWREPAAGRAERLIAEFHLPECVSSNEITLDVGEDRILLEARKKGYLLDTFVNCSIDEHHVQAKFDTVTKILEVTMPVLAAQRDKGSKQK
ncbi:PIH1 domain-containing protein 1-like [Anopheles albimanus]|uniref:PIH1 domain-containing protein 1 n=1 Tax=Anopheles albimanus TaxID=7167 RepID=A0A182F1W0_ANOAL|nr:PIH1 domain-containing protein 1-like [Anopheles albimanus]